jgi:hypothetical protein
MVHLCSSVTWQPMNISGFRNCSSPFLFPPSPSHFPSRRIPFLFAATRDRCRLTQRLHASSPPGCCRYMRPPPSPVLRPSVSTGVPLPHETASTVAVLNGSAPQPPPRLRRTAPPLMPHCLRCSSQAVTRSPVKVNPPSPPPPTGQNQSGNW